MRRTTKCLRLLSPWRHTPDRPLAQARRTMIGAEGGCMTDETPEPTTAAADASAARPFAMAGVSIDPGTSATIAIPVSNTATGLPASLYVRVLHGAKPGPCIFVSAAIHGDEIIGTAVIQRVLAKLDAASMAGTVLFLPVVNIFGFQQHSRYLPDRRDLNRSFPGSAKGSLAAQLANKFLKEVICHCSLGIDIHSAACTATTCRRSASRPITSGCASSRCCSARMR